MATKPSSLAHAVKSWWSRRPLSHRYVLLAAILIASGAIIQGAVLVAVASHVVGKLTNARAHQRLENAGTRLKEHVSAFRKLPLILSDTPPMVRIVAFSAGDPARGAEALDHWRDQLGIIFRSLVRSNPHLTQARLVGLSDDGREVVRVHRDGDRIEIVAKNDLRQIGRNHYIFAETAGLREGEVYLSPFAPSAERRQRRQPQPATMDAATPIYTGRGALFGVIVVSASPNVWLQEISAVSGAPPKFLAVAHTGDYVFRSDESPAKDSRTGPAQGFRRDWPELASALDLDKHEISSAHLGGEHMAARRIHYNPGNGKDFVVLAASSDANAVSGATRELVLLGGGIALAMTALGVLAAYSLSRPLKGLMTSARQITDGKSKAGGLTREGNEISELDAALRIMQETIGAREISLRKSEAQLQALVDNTIDGLITIDRSGIIMRFNHGCEQIFGYPATEAIGRSASILLPAAEIKLYDAYLERYARTGHARFTGRRREFKGRHKNGSLIDLEVAITEIKIEDEVLFSGIVRDITERKQMERIRSAFISTVTHELRTPLTSIMGALGLLRSGALGPLSDKTGRMVVLAHDNGTRLVRLINSIVDIDMIESGQHHFKEHSEQLKDLVARAADEHASDAAKHCVILAVDDIADDIVLNTDRDRFLQALGHLLANAVKFSPSGGTIRIGALLNDGTARISVADQGPGIPDSFRKHIFEKFAQADSSDAREKGGTGLGLSIAKALVERLGGRIDFESELGAGTTFYFELPARRVTPPQSVQSGKDHIRTIKQSA